jgi:hypothetical protein
METKSSITPSDITLSLDPDNVFSGQRELAKKHKRNEDKKKKTESTFKEELTKQYGLSEKQIKSILYYVKKEIEILHTPEGVKFRTLEQELNYIKTFLKEKKEDYDIFLKTVSYFENGGIANDLVMCTFSRKNNNTQPNLVVDENNNIINNNDIKNNTGGLVVEKGSVLVSIKKEGEEKAEKVMGKALDYIEKVKTMIEFASMEDNNTNSEVTLVFVKKSQSNYNWQTLSKCKQGMEAKEVYKNLMNTSGGESKTKMVGGDPEETQRKSKIAARKEKYERLMGNRLYRQERQLPVEKKKYLDQVSEVRELIAQKADRVAKAKHKDDAEAEAKKAYNNKLNKFISKLVDESTEKRKQAKTTWLTCANNVWCSNQSQFRETIYTELQIAITQKENNNKKEEWETKLIKINTDIEKLSINTEKANISKDPTYELCYYSNGVKGESFYVLVNKSGHVHPSLFLYKKPKVLYVPKKKDGYDIKSNGHVFYYVKEENDKAKKDAEGGGNYSCPPFFAAPPRKNYTIEVEEETDNSQKTSYKLFYKSILPDGENNHYQYVDDYLYSKKMEGGTEQNQNNRGLRLLDAIKSENENVADEYKKIFFPKLNFDNVKQFKEKLREMGKHFEVKPSDLEEQDIEEEEKEFKKYNRIDSIYSWDNYLNDNCGDEKEKIFPLHLACSLGKVGWVDVLLKMRSISKKKEYTSEPGNHLFHVTDNYGNTLLYYIYSLYGTDLSDKIQPIIEKITENDGFLSFPSGLTGRMLVEKIKIDGTLKEKFKKYAETCGNGNIEYKEEESEEVDKPNILINIKGKIMIVEEIDGIEISELRISGNKIKNIMDLANYISFHDSKSLTCLYDIYRPFPVGDLHNFSEGEKQQQGLEIFPQIIDKLRLKQVINFYLLSDTSETVYHMALRKYNMGKLLSPPPPPPPRNNEEKEKRYEAKIVSIMGFWDSLLLTLTKNTMDMGEDDKKKFLKTESTYNIEIKTEISEVQAVQAAQAAAKAKEKPKKLQPPILQTAKKIDIKHIKLSIGELALLLNMKEELRYILNDDSEGDNDDTERRLREIDKELKKKLNKSLFSEDALSEIKRAHDLKNVDVGARSVLPSISLARRRPSTPSPPRMTAGGKNKRTRKRKKKTRKKQSRKNKK